MEKDLGGKGPGGGKDWGGEYLVGKRPTGKGPGVKKQG